MKCQLELENLRDIEHTYRHTPVCMRICTEETTQTLSTNDMVTTQSLSDTVELKANTVNS